MNTTLEEALNRTEWMLSAGYVTQNPGRLAAVRLLREYRYEGLPGGLLLPLAAAGFITADPDDGQLEIDLARLTRAGSQLTLDGVTQPGLKLLGFAAALALTPSLLGADQHGMALLADAFREAERFVRSSLSASQQSLPYALLELRRPESSVEFRWVTARFASAVVRAAYWSGSRNADGIPCMRERSIKPRPGAAQRHSRPRSFSQSSGELGDLLKTMSALSAA